MITSHYTRKRRTKILKNLNSIGMKNRKDWKKGTHRRTTTEPSWYLASSARYAFTLFFNLKCIKERETHQTQDLYGNEICYKEWRTESDFWLNEIESQLKVKFMWYWLCRLTHSLARSIIVGRLFNQSRNVEHSDEKSSNITFRTFGASENLDLDL